MTGSSVLALKYRDGVMMCADTLGSYGSMAKFTDLCRLRAVGKSTLIGASGEYSDFQHIMDLLGELVRGRPLPRSRPCLPNRSRRDRTPPSLPPSSPPPRAAAPRRRATRRCWPTARP